MHLIIEPTDWQKLSNTAREELFRLFAESVQAPSATPTPSTTKKGFRWRVPYDLTPQMARKLLRGLSDDAKKRLQLFARRGGRVGMRELLAVTEDSDLHLLSAFEGMVTRKLRRLVGDDNKIVSLIMWDYEAEQWDAAHAQLVDGVFYVSDATAKALQACFAGQRPQSR